MEAVTAKVHEDLGQAEGIRPRVFEGRENFFLAEGRIVRAWGIRRESELEILLFSCREPFGGSFGFGIVGED